MARQAASSFCMQGAPIMNVSFHPVAELPDAPATGQYVFLTTQDGLYIPGVYYFNGTAWRRFAEV